MTWHDWALLALVSAGSAWLIWDTRTYHRRQWEKWLAQQGEEFATEVEEWLEEMTW